MSAPIPRRTLLKNAGIALALPWLDAMQPRLATARSTTASAPPQRLVTICTSLGIHAPFLFPQSAGRDYESTPYLDLLNDHRSDFTLFSGLSHPDQSGADGHSSEQTWLTSARHPGLGGFRNTISIDQLIAESIGVDTRHPSLVLGTNNSSQSYTRSGIMIPAESRPSVVFARLFLDGKPEDVAAGMQRIADGRSIMDTVGEQARRLEGRVSSGDREKLDEYFQSVREMEQRLARSAEWSKQPKPAIDAAQPQDIADEKDLIGRMQLLFDLIPLALQTDSTRLITVLVQGRNDVPPVPGVSIDHHNLSHHGQDEAKIAQLRLIEEAEFQAFAKLLSGLKSRKENGVPLLGNTAVLFGSNLGNANAHDTRNLPIILAGGRFRHGNHVALDANDNTPLSNLFVQLGQQLGIELDSFGSSSASSVPGLDEA
jgi:hypothetical protein